MFARIFEDFDILKMIIQVGVLVVVCSLRKKGENEERKDWWNLFVALLLCVVAGVAYDYAREKILLTTGIDISEVFLGYVKTGYKIFVGNISFFFVFVPLLIVSELYFGSDNAKVFRRPKSRGKLYLWRLVEIVILWLISRGISSGVDQMNGLGFGWFETLTSEVEQLF